MVNNKSLKIPTIQSKQLASPKKGGMQPAPRETSANRNILDNQKKRQPQWTKHNDVKCTQKFKGKHEWNEGRMEDTK